MIRYDQELAVMRERVAKLETLLETLRTSARPEEWRALSSGYRLEIERMQGEVLAYLIQGGPCASHRCAGLRLASVRADGGIEHQNQRLMLMSSGLFGRAHPLAPVVKDTRSRQSPVPPTGKGWEIKHPCTTRLVRL